MKLCKAFKTCTTARGFSQLKEKIKSLLGNQGSKSAKPQSVIKILQPLRCLLVIVKAVLYSLNYYPGLYYLEWPLKSSYFLYFYALISWDRQ